jgi:hypothetical protein
MLTVALAIIVVLTVASLALLFWPESAADPATDQQVADSPPSDALRPIEEERSPDER